MTAQNASDMNFPNFDPRRDVNLLEVAAAVRQRLKIQELYGWPRLSEPGRFLIECSCGQWSYVGTAREINGASKGHDDSPGRNHIVKIRGLVIE